MKNLLFALLAVCAIGLYSCGDSCDVEDFSADSDESLTLANAYDADSTEANCQAYADKLQSIIDDYGDCEDETISAQVELFQTRLADLPCN